MDKINQCFEQPSPGIKLGGLAVMYLSVRVISVASFYDCSIRFWNCTNIVVIFVFHFTTPPPLIYVHI